MNGGNHEMRIKMERMLREAQVSITKAIEDIDGKAKFIEDSWVRDTGGGGHSRVLQGGAVWEKAGVNLSVVHGTMPVEALRAATERGVSRGQGDQVPFFACGLSCVMHPRNPVRAMVGFVKHLNTRSLLTHPPPSHACHSTVLPCTLIIDTLRRTMASTGGLVRHWDGIRIRVL
jgi:coproporphyrinogen III oxidase